MDHASSITSLELKHVIKHPLSILIQERFQDKDGCSRNGSRELVYLLYLAREPEIIEEDWLKEALRDDFVLTDYRGIAYFIDCNITADYSWFGSDFISSLAKWKSCKLSQASSHQPLVKQEQYLLREVAQSLSVPISTFDHFVRNPCHDWIGFDSLNGHCISYNSNSSLQIGYWRSNSLLLISSLPHLRSFDLEVKTKEVVSQISNFSALFHFSIVQEHNRKKVNLTSLSRNLSNFTNLKSLSISLCQNQYTFHSSFY